MDEGPAHGNCGRAVKCHVGRAGPRGTRPDVPGVWALSILPTRTRVRGAGREKKRCVGASCFAHTQACGLVLLDTTHNVWADPLTATHVALIGVQEKSIPVSVPCVALHVCVLSCIKDGSSAQ